MTALEPEKLLTKTEVQRLREAAVTEVVTLSDDSEEDESQDESQEPEQQNLCDLDRFLLMQQQRDGIWQSAFILRNVLARHTEAGYDLPEIEHHRLRMADQALAMLDAELSRCQEHLGKSIFTSQLSSETALKINRKEEVPGYLRRSVIELETKSSPLFRGKEEPGNLFDILNPTGEKTVRDLMDYVRDKVYENRDSNLVWFMRKFGISLGENFKDARQVGPVHAPSSDLLVGDKAAGLIETALWTIGHSILGSLSFGSHMQYKTFRSVYSYSVHGYGTLTTCVSVLEMANVKIEEDSLDQYFKEVESLLGEEILEEPSSPSKANELVGSSYNLYGSFTGRAGGNSRVNNPPRPHPGSLTPVYTHNTQMGPQPLQRASPVRSADVQRVYRSVDGTIPERIKIHERRHSLVVGPNFGGASMKPLVQPRDAPRAPKGKVIASTAGRGLFKAANEEPRPAGSNCIGRDMSRRPQQSPQSKTAATTWWKGWMPSMDWWAA